MLGSSIQISGQAKPHLTIEGVVNSRARLLVDAAEERVARPIGVPISAAGRDEHAMWVMVVVWMVVMGGSAGRVLLS